jgi:hypothetical protein
MTVLRRVSGFDWLDQSAAVLEHLRFAEEIPVPKAGDRFRRNAPHPVFVEAA